MPPKHYASVNSALFLLKKVCLVTDNFCNILISLKPRYNYCRLHQFDIAVNRSVLPIWLNLFMRNNFEY